MVQGKVLATQAEALGMTLQNPSRTDKALVLF